MIKAINLAKTLDYVLSFDPDKDTDAATIWTIGTIDARVMSIIKDKATAIPVSAFSGGGDGNATLNINQTNFEIVVFGLKGFKNFQDDDGKQIAWRGVQNNLANRNYFTCDPKIIEAMPEDAIAELAGKIMDINTLSEPERKNSEE